MSFLFHGRRSLCWYFTLSLFCVYCVTFWFFTLVRYRFVRAFLLWFYLMNHVFDVENSLVWKGKIGGFFGHVFFDMDYVFSVME
jgi:hypothetical protein